MSITAILDALTKINAQLADEQLLEEIGQRLAALRLEMNLSQSDLAFRAGLGVRTIQRLENGTVAAQLPGFLRVCRVLGILARLELLLPESVPSPMTQLKLHGKQRQRAVRPRSTTNKVKEYPLPWSWGKGT